MADRYDLIIRGGTLVTPFAEGIADLGIRDGRIAALGDLAHGAAAEEFDATGLHVLPGVIDSQVHFREPGLTHKEDLETGTRSALLGGVTAVLEMPNTNPSTTSPEQLADKVNRATGRAWTHFGFFMGAAAENADILGELEILPGCCGVKVFMGSSTGSLLVEEDVLVERVLRSGRRRVAVHSEDEPRLRERKAQIPEGATAAHHHIWRDEETALRSTNRLLRIARAVGRPVHVLHVTTAQEMALLADHKDVATVEVTPQHLTLAAPEAYERLGSKAQMNPPIRTAEHRAALWQALQSGLVDVIGSDHAPHTLEEKAKPYPQSPSGMPGVQTLLPVMLTHVDDHKLTLRHLVELVCHGPARLYGMLAKGRLALGYDADLTLVDLGARKVIEDGMMASRSGWTPFHGMTAKGWPMAAFLNGRLAMRDGEVIGPASGSAIRYADSLRAG